MELGNIVFGNSRGQYKIPRDKWSDYFYENLVEPMEKSGLIRIRGGMGNDGYDNEIFWIEPYWWGDCTCGYQEKLEQARREWKEKNNHREDCYQVELKERKLKAGLRVHGDRERGEPMIIQECEFEYEKANDIKDKIYEELIDEYDLPMRGCAVHCTCDYKDRLREFYESFIEEHGEHPESCYAVKPNFYYKPTNFKIDWYKYPMRDSYANEDVDYSRFCEIVDKCAESVKEL